jgi:hypothetical protein
MAAVAVKAARVVVAFAAPTARVLAVAGVAEKAVVEKAVAVKAAATVTDAPMG